MMTFAELQRLIPLLSDDTFISVRDLRCVTDAHAPDAMLTVDQAAKIVGCSPQQMRRYLSKIVGVSKVGKRYLIPRDSLHQFLQRGTTTPAPAEGDFGAWRRTAVPKRGRTQRRTS